MNAINPSAASTASQALSARGECGSITVALINNMPDAAMAATERQFAALLSAASDGLLVRLKLYSWPGLPRAAAAQARIAAHYEDFASLENDAPDALIVTGAEPQAVRLHDEPLWPLFRRLVDWAEEERIPAIWSCMAAHAAARRLGGPERERLPEKLSGVFRCRWRHLTGLTSTRTPATHYMPHSRHSGLDASQLRKAGFDILSDSAAAGPDIFTWSGRARHVFFQGHPEYSPATLLSEYRRDVMRFLAGERPSLPSPPSGYYGQATRARFAMLESCARTERDASLLARFDTALLDLASRHQWHGSATAFYRNWLHAAQPKQHVRKTYDWRLRRNGRVPLPLIALATLSRTAFGLQAGKRL